MKIAFVTSTYLPTQNGVVTHVVSLKSWLEKFGHEVWVIAPKEDNYKDKEKNVVRINSLENPFETTYPIPSQLTIPKEIKDIRFDIIHLHHPFGVYTLARRLSKLNEAPLVFTNHTQYETYAKSYFPMFVDTAKSYIRLHLKNVYGKFDKIIVSTKDIEKYVKKIYRKANTVVSPVGFNEIILNKKKEDKLDKKTIGLKDDDFFLLYVGRVAREKNIDLLLESVEKARKTNDKIQLVLAGGGDYLSQLKDSAPNYVKYLGPTNPEDLAVLYSNCDLFVSASTSETLGLVFAEAAYCGAPLLGIDSDGVRDVIKNGVNGILAKNEAEFTEELIYLSLNKHELKKLAKNSYESSLPFTSEISSKNIENIYTLLLEKKNERQ